MTARGGSWLDRRVAQRVLQSLRLVAQGAINAEIAGALYVSERTVKGHV